MKLTIAPFFRNLISKPKKILGRVMNFAGYEVKAINSLNGFWSFDTEFVKNYEHIRNNTVVSIDRCFMLYQLAKAVQQIPGDIAELGVYKGGTAHIILEATRGTDKKLFLFDTFEGLPPTGVLAIEKDNIENKDSFSNNSVELVKDFLSQKSDFARVIFKKGFFPQTAHGLESNKFSLVYLDADLYQSMKDGLEFFYPRMNKGGIIVIDDYQSQCWPGTTQAVHEFSQKNKISIVMTQRNQCIVLC
jgi:predicted O-methyltransferase YrrM